MRPWMQVAKGEIGVKETPGPGDNPDVVKYLQTTSIGAPYDENDETPWCSAFVNWCVEECGEEGTGSAAAASWLHWGQRVKGIPKEGDIVVLKRTGGHHVGFFTDQNQYEVALLGGNQSDAVNIKWFPKERVLSIREPKEA